LNFYERQAHNRRITVLLLGAFIAFFAVFGVLLDVSFHGFLVGGARFPILAAWTLGFSTALSLFAYYRGANMIMTTLLAQPLDANDPEHRELHNVVAEIALASGLPRPTLFVIPDPSPNALAAGRDPEHALMGITEGALALLDREETQGVVAHEMAHIANRDTLVMTLVTVLLGGVVMMADWARRSLYFGRQRRGGAPVLLAVPVLVLVIVSPLLSRLMAMAVSRQREYLADATAAEFTRNPRGLARALRKIAASRSPLRAATRGTAHLFIADPLKRRLDERSGWLADLLSTHPPVAQRIALLEGIAGKRG
jgi:heat shock protein HtpX